MSYIQKDLPNQVRGDTWVFKFYIQTSAGAPEDITGYDYWFTLKTNADDTDANAVVQVGPAVMGVVDAVAGLVTITVTPNITEDVIPGSYFYDLQEVNDSNKVSTLLIGKLKVVKDVTLTSTYSGGVPDNWERETVGDVSKDLTGFVNTTDSDYSFNSGTRTFTLFPTGTSFQLYYRGKLFVISSPKTIIIGNTPGGRYISFDPVTQNLVEGDNIPSLIDDLLVAYIYWNGTSAIIFGDERHSSARDTTWHQAQHLNFGAFWRNGGEISYTLNSNTVSLGFSNLTIADEDLVHTITHSLTPSGHYQQTIASNAVIPVLYLTGTNYTQTTPSSDPWVPAGVGLRAAYNRIIAGSGSLVEVGNGKFLTYWALATNDSQYPIKLLMGSVEHATEKAALAETFVNYGLPFPEMVPLYKIVLQTQNSFVNAAKVHIISVSEIVSRQSTATTLTEAASDSFITSASFTNGVLTLSGVGEAGASVNLDGRYYRMVEVPATSSSAGTVGDIAMSTTYLYVCIATNSWKRIGLESW
jgi:hypothetical protein